MACRDRNRWSALALAAGLACLASGCVVVKTVTPFDEDQQSFAARQLGPGDGRIAGYAFVHAKGRNYTAAGDWITLLPATPYADERVDHIYGRSHRSSALFVAADQPDADYVRLSRRVKADIHGRFAFDAVREGNWYVFATVSWEKDRQTFRYLIYDRVTLGPGETKSVVLSGN